MPYLGKTSLIAATTMLLLSMPVDAGIVSTSGAMHLENPAPNNLTPGHHESADSISLIQELQGVTLEDDLWVNILDSGFYGEYDHLTEGDIAAGTEVDSWLLHLDRDDEEVTDTLKLLGSVTFDTEVLGLIILGSGLDNSDSILGLSTTSYGGSWRGLEFITQNDWIELSEDRHTVTVKLNVDNWFDEVRIVTAVPAPGALALLGLAGIAGSRRRRTHKH